MQYIIEFIRLILLILSITTGVFVFALTINSFILSKVKKDINEKLIYKYQGFLGIGGLLLVIGQVVSTSTLFGSPIHPRLIFLLSGNAILVYVFYWFIRADKAVYRLIQKRFQKLKGKN